MRSWDKDQIEGGVKWPLVGGAKTEGELTEATCHINPAHGVVPAGRVLRAAAVPELSHEAATYGCLLSLLVLM